LLLLPPLSTKCSFSPFLGGHAVLLALNTHCNNGNKNNFQREVNLVKAK
jgi:hypothetical protein